MSYKENLESQIREEYGKLVYSYACHWEEIGILSGTNSLLNNGEILLTAASTTGIVGLLITNIKIVGIIGAICSALALAITLYARDNNIERKISKHQETADELWLIREKYISLLTDISILDESEISSMRDELLERSAIIYKNALPTSQKSYSNAQMQLKEKGYQYFEQSELNKMLPEYLRKIEKTRENLSEANYYK